MQIFVLLLEVYAQVLKQDGSIVAGYHVEYAYAAAEGTAGSNAPAAPPFGLGGVLVRRLLFAPAEHFGFEN